MLEEMVMKAFMNGIELWISGYSSRTLSSRSGAKFTEGLEIYIKILSVLP